MTNICKIEPMGGFDQPKWKSTYSNNDTRWKKMYNDGDSLPLSFQKSSHNQRFHDEDEMRAISEFFDKKYQFQPPEFSWQLPQQDKMYCSKKWKVPELLDMKDDLNAVKNKLNNFNLDEWHKHTRSLNKAGNVLWSLRKDIEPEFITQAWCKFYEICNAYNFVPSAAVENYDLNSVHLCEAPGAFITSLNHYLKTNHPDLKWKWISTTLNPYHEENPLSNMINDDRFILNTLENWKFGYDNTGNLMDVRNLKYMVQAARELGAVLVVTADGSIDCQKNPGEQELTVSQLMYCEVVCALHILSLGGSFVVKMFTMYEQETICVMYLLNCCFESVNVFKPATSKEGNSEVYVVCLGYKGTDHMKPWLRVLRQHYHKNPSEYAMFSFEDIPQDFIKQIKECAKKFKSYQVEVIERNIYLFKLEDNQASLRRTKRLKYLVAEEYKKRYRLQRLSDPSQEIVGKKNLNNVLTINMDARLEEGSFNDMIERQRLMPLDKLKLILTDLEKVKVVWPNDQKVKTDGTTGEQQEMNESPVEEKETVKSNCDGSGKIRWLEVNSLRCPCTELQLAMLVLRGCISLARFPEKGNKFSVVKGKTILTVQSSKFCLGRLLKFRNEVKEIAKLISVTKKVASEIPDPLHDTKLSAEIKETIQEASPDTLKKTDVFVFNYKNILWESLESGASGLYEREAFFDLMDQIDDTWRDQTIIIEGYPMLTQFTTGVIYMMGHLFDRVGFVRPKGQNFAVIFEGFRHWNPEMKRFVKKLYEEVDNLPDLDTSVLSIIPLTELIKSQEFYTCINAVNNFCVQEQVRDVIKKLI